MIITFSGIDGSGKTHFAENVSRLLQGEGIDAQCQRPAYRANDIVKFFCKDRFGDPYLYFPKLDPTFYINTLLVDWIDFLQRTLKDHEGKVLICDRYIMDVLAQGIHYNAELKGFDQLIGFFPTPDFSFFLEVEPQQAYDRLSKRKHPAIHHLESLDNLIVLNDAYKQIRNTGPWKFHSISHDTTPEMLAEQLKVKLRD